MADETQNMTDLLAALAATVAERSSAAPEASYTAALLDAGMAECARKVGEEAVEFVIAAVSGSREATRNEAADLVYHLLVALQAADVSLGDVLQELEARRGIGGHAEKASRGGGR